jgi:hypothetical protein
MKLYIFTIPEGVKMKYKFLTWSLIFCFVFVAVACDNEANDVKTIAPEYRGKWELTSFRLSSEPEGTNHTLPYTTGGITISSAGYEVGDTYVIMYGNGAITMYLDGMYSSGNSIVNPAGQSGVTIRINGNNATIISLTEIDYCNKVTDFSWE